jgi:hypothetical protein
MMNRMIFGDKSRFAVQFELDEDSGGAWMFGKFCFFIAGSEVGDYSLGTSLRDVLMAMSELLRDAGDREGRGLFELGASALYERLDAALYGGGDDALDEQATDECWARFNLTLPVDVFSGWKVFMVERAPEARLVFYDFKGEPRTVMEAELRAGEVDDVLRAAYEELDRLYDRAMLEEQTEQQAPSRSPHPTL